MYGTTAYGGSSASQCSGYYLGCGTVFKLRPTGVKGTWTYAAIFAFAGPDTAGEYPCCLGPAGELCGGSAGRVRSERAERRYRTVDPENRLVARGLETEWENRLRDQAAAEAELRRREQQRQPSSSG